MFRGFGKSTEKSVHTEKVMFLWFYRIKKRWGMLKKTLKDLDLDEFCAVRSQGFAHTSLVEKKAYSISRGSFRKQFSLLLLSL